MNVAGDCRRHNQQVQPATPVASRFIQEKYLWKKLTSRIKINQRTTLSYSCNALPQARGPTVGASSSALSSAGHQAQFVPKVTTTTFALSMANPYASRR